MSLHLVATSFHEYFDDFSSAFFYAWKFSFLKKKNQKQKTCTFSKLAGDVSGATSSIDLKPKFMQRAKTWSDEVEDLYRFQQAGYRDEIEYKQVKHVAVVRLNRF